MMHRALLLALVAVAATARSGFAQPVARADFNGDGFEDMAVGIPGETVVGVRGAGAVTVIYGSSNGLSAASDQLWSQDTAGIELVPNTDDGFGTALAAGDFNGDGRDDLAIGVPRENVGSVSDAGVVQVIYGSAAGLTAANDQCWAQNAATPCLDLQEQADANDLFGSVLTAGDFNGDGRDDLAIGIPAEDFGSGSSTISNAGALAVVYGTANGLAATNNQFWAQGANNVIDSREGSDGFGSALAAGDFNGDDIDDVAIGVPGEDLGTNPTAFQCGAVNVLYGSANRLTSTNNQFIAQTGSQGIGGDILDARESNDVLGTALAAGDFNDDGFADLAIGAPGEALAVVGVNRSNVGAVNVVFGSANRLTNAFNRLLSQDVTGTASGDDVAELDDRFGSALAAGPFGGGAGDDLAVGAPGENVGGASAAGVVNVFFGQSGGLFQAGFLTVRQGLDGLPDTPEANDRFGSSVTIARFGGTFGAEQLAIGVPFEDGSPTDQFGNPITTFLNMGAVNVTNAISPSDRFLGAHAVRRFWSQEDPNLLQASPDSLENNRFGSALAGSRVALGAGFSGTWLNVGEDCKQAGKDPKCTLQGLLAVTNPGNAATASSLVRFFVSTDTALDDGDVLVAEVELDSLDSGESTVVELGEKLRKGQSTAGHYVIALLDANDETSEIDENNNVVVSQQVP